MTKYFLSLYREKEKLISRRVCFSRARLYKMHAVFLFFSFICLFVFLFFSCVLPKKGAMVRTFHKLLGNFLATSGIWSNFLISFRATFCILNSFSRFLCNSQISEQPLELKLAFLKKRPDPPPWDRSWAQDACSRAARSVVFKRNGGRILSPVKKDIQQVYWFILEFLQD